MAWNTMYLNEQAGEFLFCTYSNNFTSEDDIPKIVYIENFIVNLNPDLPVSKLLKFLHLCLKETFLFKPCRKCDFDKIHEPHTHASHLKKWLFQFFSIPQASEDIQLSNLIDLIDNIPYRDKATCHAALIKQIEGQIPTHDLCQAIYYSMALTIAGHIKYPGNTIEARLLRHAQEEIIFRKIRKIIGTSYMYIRLCANFSMLGNPSGHFSNLHMHNNLFGCDCRGMIANQSFFYMPGAQNTHEQYTCNLTGVDMGYAELADAHLPLDPNFSNNLNLGYANIFQTQLPSDTTHIQGLDTCTFKPAVTIRTNSSCAIL